MTTTERQLWTGEIHLTNGETTVEAQADLEFVHFRLIKGVVELLNVKAAQQLAYNCPKEKFQELIYTISASVMQMFAASGPAPAAQSYVPSGEASLQTLVEAFNEYLDGRLKMPDDDDPTTVAQAFMKLVGSENSTRLIEQVDLEDVLAEVESQFVRRGGEGSLAGLKMYTSQVWGELERIVQP